MRLGRSKWFADMRAELTQRGYSQVDACPGLFARYKSPRSRLIVESRKRNALRIVYVNGVDTTYPACTIESACRLIDAAELER
jgi:hypothetical protein